MSNIKVKLFAYHSNIECCLRVYNHMMTSKNSYKNLIFTNKDDECDYYILINKENPNDNVKFKIEKTILLYMEPYSTRENYGFYSPINYEQNKNKFYFIFDTEKFHNAIEWHITYNYNFLKNTISNNYFIDKKNKNLSAICSSNYSLPGHILRVNFLKYLDDKNLQMDVYGRIFQDDANTSGKILKSLKNYKGEIPGHCHISGAANSQKEKGLENYKYHIACENSFEKGYFTEKLADGILCECLVFYDGCTNIFNFFDERSIIKINLQDFEGSYNIIKNAIKNNEWEKRINYIKEAKSRIIDKYNFLQIAHDIINK